MSEITSTAETIHGLLLLEDDRITVQWRVHRATDRVGVEIRQEEEIGPVHEVEIPIDAVAKVAVRKRWWHWRPRLVLTASDLRAFEPLAGQKALRSTHPGEIVLHLRRGDDLPAREFAAEIALASAQRLESGRR